jgi:hypothetical protein
VPLSALSGYVSCFKKEEGPAEKTKGTEEKGGIHHHLG